MMANAAAAASSVLPRWLLESNLTDLDEDDVAALINDVNSSGGGGGGTGGGGDAVRKLISPIECISSYSDS